MSETDDTRLDGQADDMLRRAGQSERSAHMDPQFVHAVMQRLAQHPDPHPSTNPRLRKLKEQPVSAFTELVLPLIGGAVGLVLTYVVLLPEVTALIDTRGASNGLTLWPNQLALATPAFVLTMGGALLGCLFWFWAWLDTDLV